MDSKTRKAVTVIGRKDTRGYITYTVTIPKEFAKELNIDVGDILIAQIAEIEIDGAKRKVLVYYKAS
jgi:bifunctional DNA-binding transcriptional regulator/antitoxin component of YhaV-PrlF toxin-antitoxin module